MDKFLFLSLVRVQIIPVTCREILIDFHSYQVIIDILELSLVKNGVMFRYAQIRLIFKMATSPFVDVSEEEIKNIMKEKPFRETSSMRQSSE